MHKLFSLQAQSKPSASSTTGLAMHVVSGPLKSVEEAQEMPGILSTAHPSSTASFSRCGASWSPCLSGQRYLLVLFEIQEQFSGGKTCNKKLMEFLNAYKAWKQLW